jgi:hypothetical protein
MGLRRREEASRSEDVVRRNVRIFTNAHTNMLTTGIVSTESQRCKGGAWELIVRAVCSASLSSSSSSSGSLSNGIDGRPGAIMRPLSVTLGNTETFGVIGVIGVDGGQANKFFKLAVCGVTVRLCAAIGCGRVLFTSDGASDGDGCSPMMCFAYLGRTGLEEVYSHSSPELTHSFASSLLLILTSGRCSI